MRNPDIEVIFNFLTLEEGGRELCVSGYRPAHKVNNHYLTTGIHQYYDKDIVHPGEFIMGTITFITPEYYPKSLWIDKVISIQEGGRIIGYAKILKIFNDVLQAPKDLLAFRIYPEPTGAKYFQLDLSEIEKVEQIFDYCQILEAVIYNDGWDFLINYYGYETLFEINKKSGWLNSENIDEFKLDIESNIKNAQE